jgi:hypothetical protein
VACSDSEIEVCEAEVGMKSAELLNREETIAVDRFSERNQVLLG